MVLTTFDAAATAFLDLVERIPQIRYDGPGLGDQDPVVETAGGGMRVSDYLPTRTFELTVHGIDIAGESALALGVGVDVLLALTGRQPLPPNCSVVP